MKILVIGLRATGVRDESEIILEYEGEIPRYEDVMIIRRERYPISAVHRVIIDGKEDHVEVYV